MASLDRLRAFQQPPDRTGHSGTDQGCEHETQYGGKRSQGHGNENHLTLCAHCLVGFLAQQDHHVPPHAFQFLIEFIAQFIDTIKFLGNAFCVAGIQQKEEAIVLCIEPTTGVVIYCVETGLKLPQRRCIAQRRSFLDQSMDQGACRQDFQLNLPAQCVKAVL